MIESKPKGAIKMRKIVLLIGTILLLASLVACAAPGDSAADFSREPYPQEVTEPSPPSGVMPTVPTAPATKSIPTRGSGINAEDASDEWQSVDSDRMIVRTGNISLLVEDVTTAIDDIAALAESFKGYVVSSSSWKEGERLVGFISIRVPAERYNETTKALRDMAAEVTSESSSSKDVTEEYTDLESKLRNLEVTEEQLLKLMEKATKVEEILSVQRELSNTRGEIEQTKGRMQYLERTSATSLIEVHLEQSKLDVRFTADRRFVKSGQEVRFYPEIAGGFAPYSYEWDFGDGNTSNSVSPVHTYKLSGNYDVTLKVTDDRGNTDSEMAKEYIVVLSGWKAGTTASSAWSGLVAFGRVLASVIIWIGMFSPVWIVIGGIVYWFWWRRRRKV
jgi:PKD repeat protein